MSPNYAKIRRQLIRQAVEKSQIIYAPAKDWSNELQWVKIGGQGGPRRLTSSTLIDAAPEGEDPAPAVIATVVLLPRNRSTFFKSDGGWTAQSKGIRTEYAKARAQCNGIDPEIDALAGDFESTISLLSLTIEKDLAEGKTIDHVGGVIDKKAVKNMTSLKLVHHLFEPRSDKYEDPEDKNWRMDEWPTWSPDAATAHQQIAKSHVPLFIPIVDASGSVIPPSNWQSAIPGSVAIVKFTMHHWNIDGRISFPAEIDSMMVLEVREHPEPTTARKEIVSHFDMLGSDSDDGEEEESGEGKKVGEKRKLGEGSEDGDNVREDVGEDDGGLSRSKGPGKVKKVRKDRAT